jgi:hypothetical protein
MSDNPQIKMILFKKRGRFTLAACRGESKGCLLLAKERQRRGPCPDCIICDDPQETIGHIYDRLSKGEA